MLKTQWMSLELNTPCVFSSLTLMSNTDLEHHFEYYKKVLNTGIGAIVLPSVNPSRKDNSDICKSISDCITINTGFPNNSKMGFSVLGPTSNIIPINYGTRLAERICSISGNVKIDGSIANIGTYDDIKNAVKELCQTNIDALELNFSCPNVISRNSYKEANGSFLKEIRSITNLPISLKITPYQDYSEILESIENEIDGITISNAYIGLIPPKIDDVCSSPFERRTHWSPSGIYGPFEKNLTFYNLYKLIALAKSKQLSLACVGGLINAEDIIQAIMIGADVVQLSSAIVWEGIGFIDYCLSGIEKYLMDKNISSINNIKGIALYNIKDNADVLGEYDKNHTVHVNTEKCKKCKNCRCCNRLCVAISQEENGKVSIDEHLCSGCKWCFNQCLNGAIEIRY